MTFFVISKHRNGEQRVAVASRFDYWPVHPCGTPVLMIDGTRAEFTGEHECVTESGATLLEIDLGPLDDAKAEGVKRYYASLR